MRTYEEYRRILELWEKEPNKKKIARETGIPRGTVLDCVNTYGSIAGLEAQRERASKSRADFLLSRIRNEAEVQCAYAYALGLYLGDGYINLNKNERSYRLRIALDKKYPNIIERCTQALLAILPNNKVTLVSNVGHFDVTISNKHLVEIFPQHGKGTKHTREIKLEVWQQIIVDLYPLEFFRGLYHSDGSRYSNVVKGKDYPRYQFTNVSKDIIRLFSDTCDKLGFEWTAKTRLKPLCYDIYISKRKDVDYLDQVIGAKS